MINNIFLRLSKHMLDEIEKSKSNPFAFQRDCFRNLITCGSETAFGKEHNFEELSDLPYQEQIDIFRKYIPIRDYDGFVPYINRIRNGEDYVLWNQKVKWFAKSSGTSLDKSKYIPVTPDSLYTTHYGGFKRMLANYISCYPNSTIFNGKALTLGGSVQRDKQNGIMSGDLSAILLNNSPIIAEFARTPKKKIALMSNFNTKIEAICESCAKQNVTNFSGVPSWNLMLINKLLNFTGKANLLEVWPKLELFMHGGIGFDPYREIYQKLIPKKEMHYLENYNASEGYFAFQDDLSVNSMLLTVNNGIFYEFVPLSEIDKATNGESYNSYTLEEVKTNINYAIIISSVNGLWRYLIGDCVTFTSLLPHRIKVSGRTKLFINAFGEELMIGNAEQALYEACKIHKCSVTDFTVAPVFMKIDRDTKGRHKWAIEFSTPPKNYSLFASTLDNLVTSLNSDYEAKRKNNATMEQLELVPLKNGTFYKWMEKRGKIGGQNKVPRLFKDTSIIDELLSEQ